MPLQASFQVEICRAAGEVRGHAFSGLSAFSSTALLEGVYKTT